MRTSPDHLFISFPCMTRGFGLGQGQGLSSRRRPGAGFVGRSMRESRDGGLSPLTPQQTQEELLARLQRRMGAQSPPHILICIEECTSRRSRHRRRFIARLQNVRESPPDTRDTHLYCIQGCS
jgi:hypothetical protein